MKLLTLALILTFLFNFSLKADHFKFVSLEFPPLEFKGTDGKPTGIAVDIVKRIMKKLNHTVEIEIYPWARSLNMTKEGLADAIFTAYKNRKREIFLDYSKNVMINQTVVFYVNKNSSITYDGDLMKLKNKKIGITNTISYGKHFDNVKKNLSTMRAPTLKSNFRKLKLNRVDMVISNMHVGDSTIKNLGLENEFVKLSPVVQSVKSFIAFSKIKKLTALRKNFDTTLKKMKADGSYAEIMLKYGVKE